MSRRIGLPCARAAANAASLQGYQSTGWCAAELRYAEASPRRRFMAAESSKLKAESSYGTRGAQRADHALGALRPVRDAHRAAMMDHEVREHRPLLAGHDLHQVLLDLHGILLLGELEQC